MSYTPPNGDNAALNYGGVYTPPNGDNVVLNFERGLSIVSPVGFAAGAFGSTEVKNGAVTVAPAGIAAGGIGTTKVDLFKRYLLPTGLSAAAFGTSQVKNRNQVVSVNGYEAWGTSLTVLSLTNREIKPSGFLSSELGTYVVSKTPIDVLPSGFLASLVGAPTVANKTRTITAPATQNFGAMGVAVVANQNQQITTSLYTATNFGSTKVELKDRRVYPSAILPFGFAGPVVTHRNRNLSPAGVPPPAFGATVVQNQHRPLHPSGISGYTSGAHTVWNKTKFVTSQGFDSATVSVFPSTGWLLWMRVIKHTGTLVPTGVYGFGSGVPDVGYFERTLHPAPIFTVPIPQARLAVRASATSFAATAFGNALAETKDEGVIKQHGFDGAACGDASLSSRLHATGFDGAVVGSAKLSHLTSFEGFVGAFGAPTLSYLDGTDFVCGALPRAVPPQGFSSTSFGTAGVSQ